VSAGAIAAVSRLPGPATGIKGHTSHGAIEQVTFSLTAFQRTLHKECQTGAEGWNRTTNLQLRAAALPLSYRLELYAPHERDSNPQPTVSLTLYH